MKKILYLIVIMAAAALIMACGSTAETQEPESPPPAAQPPASQPPASQPPASQPPATQPPPATTPPPQRDEGAVYEQYAGDLILDGARRYTVVSGDTLVRIARNQYGNGFYYPIIMMASRDVVQDPDRLRPGMVLTIPDINANINNPGARVSIRNFLFDIAIIEEQRNRQDTASGLRDIANSL